MRYDMRANFLKVFMLQNNTVKSSDIVKAKTKFFVNRVLTYFFFFLFPIWAQKTLSLETITQVGVMILYIFFCVSQWFLLGKEVDHRLKIYYRVNSSFDRILYRVIIGKVFTIFIFNLFYLLPFKWSYNFYWVFWIGLGIFYSWPTRGKIIQESVSSNFSEFGYLDNFEKTIVFLIFSIFFISIPHYHVVPNLESLKLGLNVSGMMSSFYWNYLEVNYIPFWKYPGLFNHAINLNFYVIGMGLYLGSFYALLRIFVSRRLSILGVFCCLTSWSFSKILVNNVGVAFGNTYSVIWVWAFYFLIKSGTYRAGLFQGVYGLLGALFNKLFIIPIILQLIIILRKSFKNKTNWYKKQFLKYALFGIVISLAMSLFAFDLPSTTDISVNLQLFFKDLIKLLDRKAFLNLSAFGVLVTVIGLFFKEKLDLPFNEEQLKLLFLAIGLEFIIGILFDLNFIIGFNLLWKLVFLSLIPLEILFQSISRLRSRRNMIYLVYILICLLDSHIEGRLKIFYRLVN